MEKTKGNVAFASAFYNPSSKDCKYLNSMQTHALLNFDKKYCKTFVRAKQLPVKGLLTIDVTPSRRSQSIVQYTQIERLFFPIENLEWM